VSAGVVALLITLVRRAAAIAADEVLAGGAVDPRAREAHQRVPLSQRFSNHPNCCFFFVFFFSHHVFIYLFRLTIFPASPVMKGQQQGICFGWIKWIFWVIQWKFAQYP